jgi:hypothetical protein
MTADCGRIECAVQNDSRLLAGIAAIVAHAARSVGISDGGQGALAREALAACRDAFAALPTSRRDPAIGLIVDRFPDRIEVVVEHTESGHPDSGPDRTSPSPGGGLRHPGGADHVQRVSVGGRARVKFIKYCGALDSKRAE